MSNSRFRTMRLIAEVIGSTGTYCSSRRSGCTLPSIIGFVSPVLPMAILRGRTRSIPWKIKDRVLSSSLRDKDKKQDCTVIPQELALSGSQTTMFITDAQIHLWEVNRPDRPWMKGLQRPPHRPNGFSAEEILAEMDAVGVNRAILVPPTWVGDNNQSVLEAAARYPNRFAVVGRFNAKAPDAREQLGRWLDQNRTLGI